MTAAAVFALLRKVPGMAWVCIIAAGVLFGSALAIWQGGKASQRVETHRIALHDSAIVQRAHVDTAAAKSDSVVRVARKVRLTSDSGRARVRAVLADTTLPASVVAAVDSQLVRDSTAIVIQAAAIDTLLAERAARVQLDTISQHELEIFKPPSRGVSAVRVVETVAVVVVVAKGVQLLLGFLHP